MFHASTTLRNFCSSMFAEFRVLKHKYEKKPFRRKSQYQQCLNPKPFSSEPKYVYSLGQKNFFVIKNVSCLVIKLKHTEA